VGGRLRYFWRVWEKLGADPWLVTTLKTGYRLEFETTPPPLRRVPLSFPLPSDPTKRVALTELLEGLLEKRVVERVSNTESPGFYSRFFVTPKKESGKWRAILDLTGLNSYLKNQKFKMETAESIRGGFSQGEWASSIDLQDAYFHVPIHHTHHKYLRFAVGERIFQFVALPMGAKPSGQIFTRVVTPVKGIAHRMGIHMNQYLDDWIVKGASKEEVEKKTDFILWLTEAMGFLVNRSKSELVPAQDLVYLGYHFHLDKWIVRPTEERWEKIQKSISQFLSVRAPPARQWLQVIGLLASTEKLVHRGMLQMRPVQFALRDQWRMSTDKLSTLVAFTAEAKIALQWWTVRENIMAGIPIAAHSQGSIQVFTDASTTGWGGHLDWQTTGGSWNATEKALHINVLELRAVLLTLRHFQTSIKGKSILLSTDNSTTVAYINRQGGLRSKALYTQTLELFTFLEENKIEVRAKHIPGKLNVLADQLSRDGEIVNTEWSLHPSIIKAIWSELGTPHVDLFATRFNHKLPTYVSPIPDKMALTTDAMTMDWTGLWVYAFPPTTLMNKVMDKFNRENCEMILIAPWWPNQPWFTTVLSSLIDFPRKLPDIKRMLKQPRSGIFHNSPETLKLHAWRLSGDDSRKRDFLWKLQKESPNQSNPPQRTFMKGNGEGSVIGAIHGTSIPQKLLYLN
jgi:hypothetical protein